MSDYRAALSAFLHSRDFYEICQAYRNAGDPFPKADGLMNAADAFHHLKTQILAALPSPALPKEPVAWMTDDGRIATSHTKSVMASSSKANFNIPLFAAPAAPGMVLVPVEPTEAMLKAYLLAVGADAENLDRQTVEPYTGQGNLRTLPEWQLASEIMKIPEGYRAMLSAAKGATK